MVLYVDTTPALSRNPLSSSSQQHALRSIQLKQRQQSQHPCHRLRPRLPVPRPRRRHHATETLFSTHGHRHLHRPLRHHKHLALTRLHPPAISPAVPRTQTDERPTRFPQSPRAQCTSGGDVGGGSAMVPEAGAAGVGRGRRAASADVAVPAGVAGDVVSVGLAADQLRSRRCRLRPSRRDSSALARRVEVWSRWARKWRLRVWEAPLNSSMQSSSSEACYGCLPGKCQE